MAQLINLSLCQDIIGGALVNKYPELSRHDINNTVEAVWNYIISVDDETKLLSLLKPIYGPQNDITNQVVVLQLIDKFWTNELAINSPIKRIHNALFGNRSNIQWRTSKYVTDFTGFIKTPAIEVVSRFDEIEKSFSSLLESFSKSAWEMKAFFLAYIFSAIIRIHPFEDGNGRTARMTIQYALMSWEHPPILIPKVRNDPTWKQSLTSSLAGHLDDLQEQFLIRIDN